MSSALGEESLPEQVAITVEEALRLPCLSAATVFAGSSGLERRIQAVNVMEDVDIVRWMRGGELLLTTGYSIREDPSALLDLLPALAGRQLAGLAIKLGLYVDELPGELRSVADQLAFPLIGLPPSLMFHDIFAEVLGTVLNRQAVELERSNAIHARLTRVALEGGSFSELVTTVAELVHRPTAILDVHGDRLAATVDFPEDLAVPFTSRPIKIGDQVHGKVVIWVEQDAELLPHELKTMEHAATVAATAIAQERAVASSEQRHRTLLLMQLVTRRAADRPELARWATAMGWDMDLERAVVLVELHDANGQLSVAGQPLEEQSVRAVKSAAGPDTIVWGLRSGLALLVEPRASLKDRCREVHNALRRTRRGMKVIVAAGTIATDIDDLGRSWQDAQSTLALGRELAGDDFVLEHDELGVFRLLSRLPSTELRRQRDDMLGSLLQYDELHSGSLLDTLDVFLRCERNRVRAAQELFIHYNTLRYRLVQIDRLTGGLSSDPARRLNIELALCAHRLLRGRGDD